MPACFWILFLMIIACWVYPFMTKQFKIWSPITFVSLYLFYYAIIPYFSDYSDVIRLKSQLPIFYEQACLNLLFILIGFQWKFQGTHFKHFNSLYSNLDAKRVGICLFVLGLLCYSIFNGFKFSIISNEQQQDFDVSGSYNHPTTYLTSLISLFCSAVLLLQYVSKHNKNSLIWFIIIFTISLILYIIEGFRYRILILFVGLVTFIYIYGLKKIKLWQVIVALPLVFVVYYAMGLIEKTRSYGQGINIERLKDYQDEYRAAAELESASENYWVLECSARVMSIYKDKERIYFEPLTTALLMPIPRSLFPEKPKGEYLRKTTVKAGYPISQGRAFMNITEAYLAFGTFGVILNGFLIGLLCKLFWSNFLFNHRKIGSGILLSIFNGFLFVVISRGYLAQQLTVFVYFVIMPFWITMLFKKVPYLKDYIVRPKRIVRR